MSWNCGSSFPCSQSINRPASCTLYWTWSRRSRNHQLRLFISVSFGSEIGAANGAPSSSSMGTLMVSRNWAPAHHISPPTHPTSGRIPRSSSQWYLNDIPMADSRNLIKLSGRSILTNHAQVRSASDLPVLTHPSPSQAPNAPAIAALLRRILSLALSQLGLCPCEVCGPGSSNQSPENQPAAYGGFFRSK